MKINVCWSYFSADSTALAPNAAVKPADRRNLNTSRYYDLEEVTRLGNHSGQIAVEATKAVFVYATIVNVSR